MTIGVGNISPRVVGTLVTETSENTNQMALNEIGLINTHLRQASASEELLFPLFVE